MVPINGFGLCQLLQRWYLGIAPEITYARNISHKFRHSHYLFGVQESLAVWMRPNCHLTDWADGSHPTWRLVTSGVLQAPCFEQEAQLQIPFNLNYSMLLWISDQRIGRETKKVRTLLKNSLYVIVVYMSQQRSCFFTLLQ